MRAPTPALLNALPPTQPIPTHTEGSTLPVCTFELPVSTPHTAHWQRPALWSSSASSSSMVAPVCKHCWTDNQSTEHQPCSFYSLLLALILLENLNTSPQDPHPRTGVQPEPVYAVHPQSQARRLLCLNSLSDPSFILFRCNSCLCLLFPDSLWNPSLSPVRERGVGRTQTLFPAACSLCPRCWQGAEATDSDATQYPQSFLDPATPALAPRELGV